MTSEPQELAQARTQMRKGLLEFCTLLAISRERMYSSDILDELKAAELLVVEGTLYPLLSRMRGEGLLEYEWAESNVGPPRKYFSLTPKGKDTLEQLKVTWKALHKSIESLLK